MNTERVLGLVVVAAVGLAGAACGSSSGAGTPGSGGGSGTTGTGGGAGQSACAGLSPAAQSCASYAFPEKVNNELDVLFMVDNSSSMTEKQGKLYDQLPLFLSVLNSLPSPPSLHLAVVSSDMGAPGDSTSSLGCTQFGDQGQFQSAPRSTATLNPPVPCTDTTLATPAGQSDSNHTFIDDASGMTNFTAPVTTVLECIAVLGDAGCGFEHQLASLDRALGADGSPAPATNAGFLRPEAYLGIVILTDEDDCSAPANTQLFSLEVGGSNQQNIQNALGPIANYRCNQYGHLCKDPGGNLIMPPLNPPSNAMGTAAAPTLDLTDCQSNDTASGLLTPVSQFVADIKALKPDPDNQIVVGAIAGPAAPYTVEWIPESGGQNTQAGELWPSVMHSCGATGAPDVNPEATQHPTDGSFADPGVRISQFAASFKNSVIASVCDPSYAASVHAIATKLGQLAAPPCVTDVIQNDENGNPNCKVVESVETNNVVQSSTIPSCAASGDKAPCWQLTASGSPTCAGQVLQVNDTAQNLAAQSVVFKLGCSVCVPGAGQLGCP